MRKLFLLLALSVPAEGREQDAIAEAKRRNVMVYTEENVGSGVLIECSNKRGTVLTVFHVLQPHSNVMVNGQKAKVIKSDHEHDLLLLSTPCGDDLQPPAYGKVEEGDHILYVGNPLKVYNVLIFGRVARMDKDTLVLDASVLPGSSGSGVWNMDGQLVGIVNRAVEGEKGGSLGLAHYPVNSFR